MGTPRRPTIRKVVEYLEEYGLSVYGPFINLKTGQEEPGCRDYSGDDIFKFIELIKKDKTWREHDD